MAFLFRGKTFKYLLQWSLLCSLLALSIGTAGAAFLYGLQWVTDTRECYPWLIYLLPLAGGLIGYAYQRYGKTVIAGNDLLINYVLNKEKSIPSRIAPMILLSTLCTHLFGGSAGREGTALQMAAGISTPIIGSFRLPPSERKVWTLAAIAAGFSAVFGTPFAGCIFALEFFKSGTIYIRGIIPVLCTALAANAVSHAWQAQHTIYEIGKIPDLSYQTIAYALLVGAVFGICAWIFCKGLYLVQRVSTKYIPNPILRPMIGGLIVLLGYIYVGNTYLGLGIPIIQKSFVETMAPYDFAGKLLFTVITIGFGFKGGEVTPLFFIGATLGNALSMLLPLPLAMLAAMGFVAVFAGATNTPLACTIMGIELFGWEGALYIAIACYTAYLCSGNLSIYKSQEIENNKYAFLSYLRSK